LVDIQLTEAESGSPADVTVVDGSIYSTHVGGGLITLKDAWTTVLVHEYGHVLGLNDKYFFADRWDGFWDSKSYVAGFGADVMGNSIAPPKAWDVAAVSAVTREKVQVMEPWNIKAWE
jgi:hypothetical protein